MSIEINLPENIPYDLDNDIVDYYYSYLSNKDISSFDKLTEISDVTNRNLYILGDITLERNKKKIFASLNKSN